MSRSVEDYIRVLSEWKEESLRIESDFAERAQAIRDTIITRMKYPGVDPAEVVEKIMAELDQVEKDRIEARKQCDEKFKSNLKEMRQ